MRKKIIDELGGYTQCVEETGNITCTCTHGSLFPDNWLLGEKVCKHIKTAVDNLKRKVEEKKQNELLKERREIIRKRIGEWVNENLEAVI